MVQVLCRQEDTPAIADRVLRETTTAGVRYYPVHRLTLQRQEATVITSYGEVAVKRITGVDGEVRIVPEYEGCRRIAVDQNIPIRIVYETIQREIISRSNLDDRSDGD